MLQDPQHWVDQFHETDLRITMTRASFLAADLEGKERHFRAIPRSAREDVFDLRATRERRLLIIAPVQLRLLRKARVAHRAGLGLRAAKARRQLGSNT